MLGYLNLSLNVGTLAFIVIASVMARNRIRKADRLLRLAEQHGELTEAALNRSQLSSAPPGPQQPPPAGES